MITCLCNLMLSFHPMKSLSKRLNVLPVYWNVHAVDFSLMSNFRNYLNNTIDRRQERANDKSKQDMFDFLLNTKQLTLNEYYEKLQETYKSNTEGVVNSWLPKDEAGLSEIQSIMDIISAMTYTQRYRHQSIRDKVDFQLIAHKAGVEVDKVETLVNHFHMLFMVHRVLKQTKKDIKQGKLAEEKMPKSFEEVLEEIRKGKLPGSRPLPAKYKLHQANEAI